MDLLIDNISAMTNKEHVRIEEENHFKITESKYTRAEPESFNSAAERVRFMSPEEEDEDNENESE